MSSQDDVITVIERVANTYIEGLEFARTMGFIKQDVLDAAKADAEILKKYALILRAEKLIE